MIQNVHTWSQWVIISKSYHHHKLIIWYYHKYLQTSHYYTSQRHNNSWGTDKYIWQELPENGLTRRLVLPENGPTRRLVLPEGWSYQKVGLTRKLVLPEGWSYQIMVLPELLYINYYTSQRHNNSSGTDWYIWQELPENGLTRSISDEGTSHQEGVHHVGAVGDSNGQQSPLWDSHRRVLGGGLGQVSNK